MLFKSWRPNDMDARKVVSQLGGTSEVPEELLMRTAWRLLRVDPLLMGKVVRLFARNVCLRQLGITLTSKLLHTLIAAFAESRNDNDTDLQQRRAQFLEKVSDAMGYIDKLYQEGAYRTCTPIFSWRKSHHARRKQFRIST